MSLEYQLWWVLPSVESIHMNELLLIGTGCIHCCKVLSTITEFDLLTLSEWHNLPVMLDLVVVHTNVHQSQSVTQSNHNVESRWVD